MPTLPAAKLRQRWDGGECYLAPALLTRACCQVVCRHSSGCTLSGNRRWPFSEENITGLKFMPLFVLACLVLLTNRRCCWTSSCGS